MIRSFLFRRFDTIAALVGAAIGIAALCLATLLGGRPDLLAYGFILGAACLGYIAIKRVTRMREDAGLRWESVFTRSNHIVFVLAFGSSLLLLLDGLYIRPLAYFFLIAICAISAGLDVVNANDKGNGIVPLLKILAIGINLKTGFFTQYPLIGEDALFFQHMIDQTAVTGHLASSFFFGTNTYRFFPNSIVFGADIQTVMGTGVHDTVLITMLVMSVVGTLTIYLIGRRLGNIRLALIAALLFNVIEYGIYYSGLFLLSTLFGFMLILILLFIISGWFRTLKAQFWLIVVFTLFLITSHIISGLFGAIVIVIAWTTLQVTRQYISTREISEHHPNGALTTVALVAIVIGTLVIYWLISSYFPGHSTLMMMVQSFVKFFGAGPGLQQGTVPLTPSIAATAIASDLGGLLFLFVLVLGCLFWLKSDRTTAGRLSLVAVVVILACLVYGGRVVHLTTPTMLGRLTLLLQMIGSIVGAAGILVFFGLLRRRWVVAVLVVILIGSMTFFMTDLSVGNPEAPLLNAGKGERLGFTEAEITGASTLLQDWTEAQTDRYYGVMAPFTVQKSRLMDTLDIADLKPGLVMVRSYALENPVLRATIDSRPQDGTLSERLNTDPTLSLIYDDGGVLGYVKQ